MSLAVDLAQRWPLHWPFIVLQLQQLNQLLDSGYKLFGILLRNSQVAKFSATFVEFGSQGFTSKLRGNSHELLSEIDEPGGEQRPLQRCNSNTKGLAEQKSSGDSYLHMRITSREKSTG